MASVIVSMRVMPTGTDVDMTALEQECVKLVNAFGAMSTKVTIEPIAFGLKALAILFVINEAKGSTEELENQISTIGEVQSVEVTDVRRTLG